MLSLPAAGGWGYITLAIVYVVLMILVLIFANDNPEAKGFTRMGEDEAEKVKDPSEEKAWT